MASVLIVEDERLVRDTLAKVIPWKDLGVEAVYQAEDGRRGLAMAEQYGPDLIISDIKMPQLNGIEFARAVRQAMPACRFVFLTAYADKKYLKDAIALHVDGFIEKPLDPEEITATVRALLTAGEQPRPAEPAPPFYGGGEGAAPDGRTFILPRNYYSEFDLLLRQDRREDARASVRALFGEMARRPATDPDYIRSVFSRLAFRLENAAHIRGAAAAQAESERFAYASAHVDTLAKLAGGFLDILERYFAEVDSLDPGLVAQVNQYLQAHFSESDCNVKAIAYALNYNDSYLCMVYKKKTGSTINTVLTDMRMDLACRLLRQSDMKFYEVGRRVGYPNGRYFSTLFTREVGVTPRQYREQHHER